MSVGDGDTGVGGDVNINAGKSVADGGTTGGMIILHAGESTLTSSGKLSIGTPNAGTTGVSGTIDIGSGTSSAGVTGSISMTSGKSTGGKGGTITLSVGDGDTGVGGDVNINAGKSIADDGTTGGMIVLHAGESALTSSGKLSIGTPNAGTTGISGTIDIISGTFAL